MGMFQTLAPKQIQIGSTLKWIFNEPKMLFKNVHALWIMLGTTTRGDAHFCYTFWIFESMHKYLIWSCLNYINILMAPKMLGIGEGLWNIISRCHKYFQHLWKCFNISFRYKTNVRNRKRKQEKEKAYLVLATSPAGLALLAQPTRGKVVFNLVPTGSQRTQPTAPPPASPCRAPRQPNPAPGDASKPLSPLPLSQLTLPSPLSLCSTPERVRRRRSLPP